MLAPFLFLISIAAILPTNAAEHQAVFVESARVMRANQLPKRVKAGMYSEPPSYKQNALGHLLALLRRAKAFRLVVVLRQCGLQEKKRRCACGADVGAVKQYCHQYFCPTCQPYKAYQTAQQVADILAELRKTYPGLKIFAGTFTLPACEAEELSEQLKALNSGFAKLLRKAPFRKYFIGAVRVVELAFNRQTQTFHPHLHSLIVLKATYIGKGYLSQSAVLALWQEATGGSRVPQIVFKRIRSDAARSEEENAVELVRYALKPIVPADWTAASLAVLRQAIRGRRLCEFLGAFRPVRRQLKQKKPRCLCAECLAASLSET